MKTMHLAGALALGLIALSAPARAGFEELQGVYRGIYRSTAFAEINTRTANGSAKATIRAITGGRQGRLNLFSTNDSVSGFEYRARMEFRARGIITADSLVPGVIDADATGTWSANPRGNKVSYRLTATTPNGFYTATGRITGTGENLKVKVTFVGTGVAFGAPTRGTYIYTGSR